MMLAPETWTKVFVDIKAERKRDREVRGLRDVVHQLRVLRGHFAAAVAVVIGHDVLPKQLLIVIDRELQVLHIRLDLARDALRTDKCTAQPRSQHNETSTTTA